ncbi:MAG: response regulator [Bacteroidetes bacterium]|nr:response regulator [Bacteroidota bacterium]
MSEDFSKSSKHFAHDLNNILTRILNTVELIKRKTGNSAEVTSLLSSIESSAYIASELVEDALGTAARNNSLSRRINLNSIVNDVVRTFLHQWKEQISFQLDIFPQLNVVYGKYTDYYRIFLNLITNSVEAIDGTGEIAISTKNIGDSIQIIINDTGKGIPREIIPHIFEDNFSTKTNNDLRGVGLAIVKKIIDNYHGTLSVSSEIGKGTSISIVLPALIRRDIAAMPEKKAILIAEDEDILLELLSELLQSSNYDVLTARNGSEALDKIKSESIDMLLIDQKMPGMNGTDCINEIRKSNALLPIILVTGSQFVNGSSNTISGINKIVKKPYNFEELLAVINEFLDL